MKRQWEMVAGLEIHARIKTETKMFCSCSNETFNEEENKKVCPICCGFPGALPSVNSNAVDLGLKTALALGCEINKVSNFDRKSYFYPDLPSGFQISQLDFPIGQNGKVKFAVNKEEREIRINRLHLENDAGKLTHKKNSTLVDLNRAGSPLMEIVTEADFRSPEEVGGFLRELQKILRNLNTSDADMEKGMMRCDVNISIRPKGEDKFGTKVELKNMNSFSNIEEAIKIEVNNQEKILNSGGVIIQETKGYNPDTKKISSQRKKEESADYRYFPEPDLPKMEFDIKKIEEIKNKIGELPYQKLKRFVENYQIPWDNAEILSSSNSVADFFENAVRFANYPKKISNWIIVELFALIKEQNKNFEDILVAPKHISDLVNFIESGKISGKIAKEIFLEMFNNGELPENIIKSKNLTQISSSDEIERICKSVLDNNQKIVDDYKNGKQKALGSLIGQVMKETKGKANPKMVSDFLVNYLK